MTVTVYPVPSVVEFMSDNFASVFSTCTVLHVSSYATGSFASVFAHA